MKKYKLPKELILDYKTWRCGGGSGGTGPMDGNGHGTGLTGLINCQGYLCCLGQFCIQAGVPKNSLDGSSEPCDLLNDNIYVEGTVQELEKEHFGNTKFVDNAILINDNELTTIAQKVRKLQSLCKKYRRKLVLKNFPKKILKELDNL